MEAEISKRKIKLNNGKEIPIIGFGTFQIRKINELEKALKSAIKYGYRLFDTAVTYGNEHLFSKIIPKLKIPREELIISTSSYSHPRPALPEWEQTHSMIYRMKIEDKDKLSEVMHHELFHYFDFMVSGSNVDSKIEAEWNELNPSDFKYGEEQDYKRYMENNNKEQIYFVSKPSMKQCCEDRAEIYSKLMTQTSKWKKELSNNVLKKFEKIKDFMKEHSPNYIGNIDNHYFESLQNFIDRLKEK